MKTLYESLLDIDAVDSMGEVAAQTLGQMLKKNKRSSISFKFESSDYSEFDIEDYLNIKTLEKDTKSLKKTDINWIYSKKYMEYIARLILNTPTLGWEQAVFAKLKPYVNKRCEIEIVDIDRYKTSLHNYIDVYYKISPLKPGTYIELHILLGL